MECGTTNTLAFHFNIRGYVGQSCFPNLNARLACLLRHDVNGIIEKAESKVLLFVSNGFYSAVKVMLTDALTRSFADWTVVPALSSVRRLASKTLPILLS